MRTTLQMFTTLHTRGSSGQGSNTPSRCVRLCAHNEHHMQDRSKQLYPQATLAQTLQYSDDKNETYYLVEVSWAESLQLPRQVR